jgi:predicted nucleotide-binding protein
MEHVMAQMPIEILDLRKSRDELLSSAVKLANDAQDQYHFSVLEAAKSNDLLFSVREDTDIGEFIPPFSERRSEWRGFHPFVLCLFDTAINCDNTYNLFSVDMADDGFAAVTIHNVDTVLIPSNRMTAYVLFQFAFFALKFSGCNIPFHEEDRGCLFDYREEKSGIVDAIREGKICDECKSKLHKKRTGVSSAQLTSVFELLGTASKIMQGAHVLSAEIKRKAKIFIGSSVEGIDIARAIQSELEHDFDVEIWNQSNVFVLGSATLEALESAVESYDFSIFVFTPDDEIRMRSTTKPVARDNVIFEAGLFIGKIGRHRSFIVKPRNVAMQVPSDLAGITVADYDASKANRTAAVGTACTKIRGAINNIAF